MCFRPASVSMDIECPKCGAKIPSNSTICPECGASETDIAAAAPKIPGAQGAPGAPKMPPPPGAPGAPTPPKAPGSN